MIKNIGKQLWVGKDNLSAELIQPVGEGHLGIKGKGGLWTSTFLGTDFGSGWIQWCLGNDFAVPEDGIWHGYILEPKKDLRIYTIDSLEEMHMLFDKYGYKMYPVTEMEGINWKRMAEDYDALLLTENGEAVTRHGFSFFRDITSSLKPEWQKKTLRSFYGWDCESTYHFRWNFINQESISIKAKADRDDDLIQWFKKAMEEQANEG